MEQRLRAVPDEQIVTCIVVYEALDFAKVFVVAIGEGYLGLHDLSRSLKGADGWERAMYGLLRDLALPQT